ncbi:methyltransferase domain-containing protein [Nocardiopsis sp. CA-288880]|uniref:methyltransferase domain-containing protein n=1 Tax=Nocardiopsis sp. CA-288880 TaxID=3239995 RepID=UPI003D9A0658
MITDPSSGLVDRLTGAGELEEGTVLAEAFRVVDRGAFVPAFALFDHTGQGTRYRLVDRAVPEQREEWAEHVYADQTLIIEINGEPVTEALPGGSGAGRWTSSSTMPSLMARHLRELGLEANPRVLEIGVGSGYNAAVLCEVLGDERVTSIDISPGLVAGAARALASQGYRPVVAEHDGHQGYPERAPYDRITSTTAFTHVPPAWLDQVAPGGMILVNVAGGTGGAVLRLRVGDGIAQGRFLPQGAGFMPARTHRPVERVSVDDDGEAGWTDLDPKVLTAQPEASFVAQLATVDARTVVSQADDGTELLFLEGADGAWAEVETRPVDGRHRVVQGAPRRLWDLVDHTHRWWEGEGRPSWSAFGATVTATDQWVWFGSPDSAHRWPLPVPEHRT